ncbi:ring finger protein [Diplodia corticola]|uniref:RBR-type E3 ubiquitin transferase n=1 Tax=Diplodia corticola TaxID=236234 RepID=A0A1J9S9K1_9PEZI|nr:ring finger protein [Diplodia corticola]OJD36572.1 ring finger protein [Diplodia corticola]
MQAARSLLNCGLASGVALLSRTHSDRFTNSFFAPTDHLGPKQVAQPSPASPADADTLTAEAPSPGHLKRVLSAWLNTLKSLSTRRSTRPHVHHSRLRSSQPTLDHSPKKNDPSIMSSAVVHRKPLQRSCSYEQGDDRTTTVYFPKGSLQESFKETELCGISTRASSSDSSRVSFASGKSSETTSRLDLPSIKIPVPEQNEAKQSLQSEGTHHRASNSYQTDDRNQLSFDKNDVLLISMKSEDGWWYAKTLSSHEAGWVPSNFFDTNPITEHITDVSVGGLPRRSRAVRRKKPMNRPAIVHGRPELAGAEDFQLQLYRHFSQQLLSTRQCAVCGDSKAFAEFPDETRLHCKHAWSTCRECAQAWVAAELETNGWDHIKCTETGCKAFLNHTDILQLADSATFQRYDSLATRAHLSALPDFVWCLSASCTSGQIHEDGSGPIFKCIGCKKRFCTQHKMPWHRGETCAQYDQRVSREKQEDEERATKKMLKKTTKQCPGKSCGWMIEKNHGCDHMTCRKCRHQFCWVCLAPYEPIKKHGNKRHAVTCKYHSDNLK